MPSAVEAAVHTTRSWVERHAQQNDHVLLKFDFRNAFNEVSRQTVLDMVQADFPALVGNLVLPAPFVTLLWWAKGDPIGGWGAARGSAGPPLVSCSYPALIAEQLQASMPFSVFYLDDGVVAGDEHIRPGSPSHLASRAVSGSHFEFGQV